MPDLFGVPRLFITNSGAVSSLEVAGELDVATAGALRDHLGLLVEYGTGDVDIDMASVTFCDAATLTVLVATRQQLERLAATYTSSPSPDRSSGFSNSRA